MVPTGITATAWPAVRKTCVEKLGVEFDDWQDAAGRIILAKREDDNLAAMVDGVGLSLPRQVGKTYLIGAMVFALCVNRPGLLVIWSAHHARTHGETFLAMQGFADRAKVAAHVKQVFTGSGDEEIRFHNGSRILFGARERGFGRGIPGVDVLIFDEAQILSDRALSNMLATMNTSRFGLQLYIGTPPKPEDMSEAFTRMRTEAKAGTLVDGAWIELSADNNAHADDRSQWARANPSYPSRTPAQSILRLKRKLSPDDFLREGLGLWSEDGATHIVDPANWRDQAVESAPEPTQVAYAVDMTPTLSFASIGVATPSESGVHVEVAAHGSTSHGWQWVVDWLVERRGKPVAVAIQATSPARALLPELNKHKIKVLLVGSADAAGACSTFVENVRSKRLTHPGADLLSAAVSGATPKKHNSEGGILFDRRDAAVDISPLYAVTLAAHALAAKGRRGPPRKRVIKRLN